MRRQFTFNGIGLLAAMVVLTTGCGSLFNQHAQLMDAMRGAMKDTAARLGESGSGQIAAGGHVINPGIRVSGGVEYYAVARYEGVGGQVQASMSGPLNRPVTPKVQATADAIWRDASISSEQKVQLLRELLLNGAVTSDTNTSPSSEVKTVHE